MFEKSDGFGNLEPPRVLKKFQGKRRIPEEPPFYQESTEPKKETSPL